MRWDIFCTVIDNHGDLGVCWRLAADLGARGETVRLWVDDPSGLRWMAPDGTRGVEVLHWTVQSVAPTPGDVLLEAFGCEPLPGLLANCVLLQQDGQTPPVWINLEYLSAEAWVERSHRLPSPVFSGPGAGLTRHFFYPGFTARTGGLLREPDLADRQRRFDRAAWRAAWAGNTPGPVDETWVSMFCYEPSAMPALLQRLAERPTHLLVTAGRAQQAVAAASQALERQAPGWNARQRLRITPLPLLSQPGYDELLWGCDLNFVRGEDSLVRALWSGRPFVWQIYPQSDNAHHAKLQAFLDQAGAPDAWRRFHHTWNGLDTQPLHAPDPAAWAPACAAFVQRLQQQPDLTTQLAGFVKEKR